MLCNEAGCAREATERVEVRRGFDGPVLFAMVTCPEDIFQARRAAQRACSWLSGEDANDAARFAERDRRIGFGVR